MIAILYFASVYGLEKLGSSTIWKAGVRGFIADYAYVVSPTLNAYSVSHDLMYTVCNHILGRVLPHSGKPQQHTCRTRANNSSFPSNSTPKLVDRLLEFGRCMDFRCHPLWLSRIAVILLRSCEFTSDTPIIAAITDLS